MATNTAVPKLHSGEIDCHLPKIWESGFESTLKPKSSLRLIRCQNHVCSCGCKHSVTTFLPFTSTFYSKAQTCIRYYTYGFMPYENTRPVLVDQDIQAVISLFFGLYRRVISSSIVCSVIVRLFVLQPQLGVLHFSLVRVQPTHGSTLFQMATRTSTISSSLIP